MIPSVVNRHRLTLPGLLAEGRLRMIRLTGDSRTIAVFYGIASGKMGGYYLAGYDREWAGRIRLGRSRLPQRFECARREGATEFDFLKGSERMKYVWPVHERATSTPMYSRRNPAPNSHVRRVRPVTAAAAWSKSAKGMFPASLNL
jgi:hypothetical protein